MRRGQSGVRMEASAKWEGEGGAGRGVGGTFSPRPVIRSERAFIVPSVNTSGTVGRGGRDGLSLIVPTVWLTSR